VVRELLARRVQVLRQQLDDPSLFRVLVGQGRELVGDVKPADRHQQKQRDDGVPEGEGLILFEPVPSLLCTMVSGHY
jgi:hypothetical protein